MVAPTGPAIRSTSSARTVRIARSTDSRSPGGADATDAGGLPCEIAELQNAVRSLDEFLYPRLGLIELCRCLTQQLDPFLEEFERSVEVEPVGLELSDDLFKAGEIGFE